MIKRLSWFLGGAVAGAAGVGAAKRKVRKTASLLRPSSVARATGDRVRDAVRHGKQAAQVRERELRARLRGEAKSLADSLTDDDEVFVDGVPVEPGQVIVLRQVRANGKDAPPRAPRRRA
jgi:pyridoxal biosynthesis lyase PdxS